MRLGALAQRVNVDARCHCEQNVASVNAFAIREFRWIGRMESATGFAIRLRRYHRLYYQQFNCGACRLRSCALGRNRIVVIKQAVGDCFLPQELNISALAQFVGG
jgi:hypothetical protein